MVYVKMVNCFIFCLLFTRTARANRQETKVLQKSGLHEAPPKREFKEYYGISTLADGCFQQIVWGSALHGTAVT